MQNSLISRAGRLLSSFLRTVSHVRSFRHNSLVVGLLHFVRMALQVLVWWPAFIAGAVLVVTFLTMKVNGSAEAQWLQTLEMQAAAYQGAPKGEVLSTRCDIDRNASHSADFPGMEVSAPCPPHPVSLANTAQADIAVLVSIYMALVIMSLCWLLVSEFMLPVATPRHHSGESHSGRSARSYVTLHEGHEASFIVVRTPEGEYRSMPVYREGDNTGRGSTGQAGVGRHE